MLNLIPCQIFRLYGINCKSLRVCICHYIPLGFTISMQDDFEEVWTDCLACAQYFFCIWYYTLWNWKSQVKSIACTNWPIVHPKYTYYIWETGWSLVQKFKWAYNSTIPFCATTINYKHAHVNINIMARKNLIGFIQQEVAIETRTFSPDSWKFVCMSMHCGIIIYISVCCGIIIIPLHTDMLTNLWIVYYDEMTNSVENFNSHAIAPVDMKRW